MNKCYLGLGSNQKYPQRQIRQSLNQIKAFPHTILTKTSTMHWTKAWGLQRQQDFCNVVVEIITRLPPKALLMFCNKAEQQQQRRRLRKNGPRTLDVDILLYGNRRIKTKDLLIPHPRMHLRNFVLLPLLELYPELSLG